MGVMRGMAVNEKRKKTEMMGNGVLGVPTLMGENRPKAARRGTAILREGQESLSEM